MMSMFAYWKVFQFHYESVIDATEYEQTNCVKRAKQEIAVQYNDNNPRSSN
jgi:hypothetical protein